MKKQLLLIFFLVLGVVCYGQVNQQRAGFEKEEVEQERILEPNPTLGRLQIDISKYDFPFYDLQVKNIIGKVLWSTTIYEPVKLLDLTELRKGSYFFSIKAPDGEYLEVLRLVIVNP